MGWLAAWFDRQRKVDLWKRFERLKESQSGTMSAFYKVREVGSGRILGLKVVNRAKHDPVESRYKGLGKPGEGQIGAAIAADNVVRTVAWGVSTADEPFVVTEFIDGTLLHSLITARRPFPPAQRLDLVRQAATAVAAVHAAGFVHRDICPRNFILRPDGRLVLFDFGLTVPDKPVFLQPGNRVGTPNYMAPEVVRRRQADNRLDIFSFGITAYEICTLASPWPRHHGQGGVDARSATGRHPRALAGDSGAAGHGDHGLPGRRTGPAAAVDGALPAHDLRDRRRGAGGLNFPAFGGPALEPAANRL